MPTKTELRRADRDVPLSVQERYVRRVLSEMDRHYREWLARKEAELSSPQTKGPCHAD